MNEFDKVDVLGGLLRRIGNFCPNLFECSFDARLILQKTIYLMQSFGLYIGFSFSWYIRGPYSSDLAKKGYELAKRFDQTPDVRFSKKASEQTFDEFLRFLGERKSDAYWLETLASIHFLRSTYPRKTRNEINEIIQRKQPYLTLIEYEKAWNHLKKYGLIGD